MVGRRFGGMVVQIGREGVAPYAGDVSATEAWNALERDSRSVLVDVRTDAEWTFVGVPDLSTLGRRPVLVPWQVFPSMEVNGDFAAAIRAAVPDDVPLYFICRSGARSRSAAIAMTAAGFSHCYNVAGGFEGDKDDHQHRGTLGGWKASGLPWIQS
jgi:rhodanese-related sulfurtransferase